MRKITALFIAFSLLFCMAVTASAEEEVIPYDVYPEAPGSYTSIDSQTFWWTPSENGYFTFTIDSESNWFYYVRVGDSGGQFGGYNDEECRAKTFSCWAEADALITMYVAYDSESTEDIGTVDFTFSFEPDGTGNGGYVTECTHQVSGTGSSDDPYVYDSVEDMVADWTNRRVPNSEIVTISAPLGGETLNMDGFFTLDKGPAYYSLWVDAAYQSSTGERINCGIWITDGEGSISYTFDSESYAQLPPTYGYRDPYTLVSQPWTDGCMVTISFGSGAASSASFTVYSLSVETEDEPGSGGNTQPGDLGDINGDGEIDIFDANLVVAYYNETIDLNEAQLRAADVNGDGEIDIFDANLIVAYYNETIDTFPAA